jgi:hypothetical protein
MADRQSPTPAEIVIMAAGAVMLIFSFLHFGGSSKFGRSAWQSPFFPIATLLPVYGLVMALQIALTKYAGLKLPAAVIGFSWEQVHLALGVMAGLMAIGWLFTDLGDKQVGEWFEILGGIALVVGAVMLQRERNTGAIG